jgi:hypothetical protein
MMASAGLAGAALVLAATPASAAGSSYFTDFNGRQPELAYEVYQGDVHEIGATCDTDACVTFESQGGRTYGKFTVNHSNTPGFYQNVATSNVVVGVDPAPANAGPYTVSYGHPITLEAKIKWSANYRPDGSGARGTSGVILWNSAVGTNGQTPDYSEIGFTWANQNVAGGILSGFTANSFVDLVPVGIDYPSPSLDIHGWSKVTMIWSQDANGVQSVAYYADDLYLGTDVLPSQLHGLSLEIWNDNQEPVFCDTGLCNSFPNPDQSQSFYVDYVKVTS